jgi:hypothetical protein
MISNHWTFGVGLSESRFFIAIYNTTKLVSARREYFRSFYFGDAGEMVGIDSKVYPENPSCPVWT